MNKQKSKLTKKWEEVFETTKIISNVVHYRAYKHKDNEKVLIKELDKLLKYQLFIKDEMIEKCMANEGTYIERYKSGNIKRIFTNDDMTLFINDRKKGIYKNKNE